MVTGAVGAEVGEDGGQWRGGQGEREEIVKERDHGVISS